METPREEQKTPPPPSEEPQKTQTSTLPTKTTTEVGKNEKGGTLPSQSPLHTIENPDVPQTPQPLPQENSVCVFNKHGFCKTHRLLGFTREITVYKWEDRGGGRGFGNVRRKVKKFICPAKSKAPTGPLISTWINSANQKSAARPTEEGKFEFYTPGSDQNISNSRKVTEGLRRD